MNAASEGYTLLDGAESGSLWSYRFLNPSDLAEVKDLCRIWFPVRYPETWYKDVTSSKYYSLAAIHPHDGRVLGMIVCDIKSYKQVNHEDEHLLCSELCASEEEVKVAYILSLGVIESFRRKHLATALLNKLLDYLNSPTLNQVKAVYLHVLATNIPAIKFYRKHNFQQHLFIPYYYQIAGRCKDGCSYVRYLNGGKPEHTFIDAIYDCVCKAYYGARRILSCPVTLVFRLAMRGATLTMSRLR